MTTPSRAPRFPQSGFRGPVGRDVSPAYVATVTVSVPHPALLAACLVLTGIAAQAQTPAFADRWRWARFSTMTGLPSNTITAIAETRDGTPWVATTAGFAWFDGYRWHPIGPAARNEPEARSPVLVADPGGGVTGVLDGRLFRGDTSGLLDITPSIGGGGTLVLDAEPTRDGALVMYLSPDSAIAFGVVGPDGFRTIPPPGPARLSVTESSLWGGHGPVILTTPSGASAWSGDRWSPFLGITSEGSNTHVALAPAGRMLLYSNGPGNDGLWESPDSRTFRRLVLEGAQQAVALAVRDDGEAIAAYEAGTVRYRSRDRWRSIEPVPAGLRDVTVLAFRANGDLWTGTRHGLYLYRRSSARWTTSERPFPDRRNRVNAIALTREGTVWLGTGDGVVVRRADGTERSITHAAGVRLGAVTAVAVDSLDRVWLGSGAAFVGAVRFDGRVWRRFGPADGLPAYVHRIERDRQGRLWFLGLGGPEGAASRGAFVADGGRIERWDRGDVLTGRRVYAFAEGRDGAYWFGTSAGLKRWRGGQWTQWPRPQWSLVRRVFTLAVDDSGQAWFADQHGGVGVAGLDDSLRRYTSADGLVDDRVWEIRSGRDGRMWFATAGGLGSYRNGVWARFGDDQGLEAPQLWPLLPQDDRVLVGTLGKGLTVLSLEEEDTPPVVRIEPAGVFGRTAQLRWQPLSYWGLAPQENIATRYRMDEDSWSPWSTDHEVAVALAGGRHRIEVQALSIFGRVGPTASRSFAVPRPLPLRPGFIIPVGLVVAGLGGLGARAVAQRRRERRQMAALEDQLRQAQKMEAIGQLAGGVAHDFNNILTAIMGHAELLAASLPAAQAAARQDVEEIRVTAERGAAMIRKLLMFGRKGRLEVGPVRLAAVAGDLTAMLARLMPERIRLVVSQQGDVTALADRAALEQILVNLATNARDAMPDGGELRIAASVRRLDLVEAVRCGLSAEGSYACLEVNDSGIGMSGEMLTRIFEPFFTTKEPGKGTGLGMAMVYSLVRQQQGGIEIRSAPGAGTRVRLFFPLAPTDGVPAVPAAPAPDSPDSARDGTILVVEDDPTVRAATGRLLERKGYRVVAAADGEAALAILRRDAARIDIVVTDVMMPRMSGFALHAAARAEGLDVPFIFTSGYSEHPDAGAPPQDAVFLPKPWAAAALLAQVGQSLEAARAGD